MPTATNSPTPMSPTAGSGIPTANLPPPSTFDILPPLHDLLARLLLAPSGNRLSSSPPSQNTQSNGNDHNQSPLYPKDLATAASAVTTRIQKARAAVQGMEGISLGLEDQEDIIDDLETEVERLVGVLESLKNSCGTLTTKPEPTEMEVDEPTNTAVKED